jgi:hypothetical protein
VRIPVVLLLLVAGGGCNEAGRPLLLVHVEADATLPLTDVRVVASQVVSGRRWTIDHAWSGETLNLGVYLPKDTTGQVTVVGCGFDSANQPVAFATGAPSSVAVQPGTVTAEVTVDLLPGTTGSAADCGAVVPADGGSDGTMEGPAGGLLAINHATLPASVDLTAEGTLDWVYWGYPNLIGVNRKAGGSHPIGELNPQGIGSALGGPSFIWSDGAPTVANMTSTGIYTNIGCVPPYFTWTAQATATQRTLRLYISANSQTTLTAHLSDGSAPDATLTSSEITADVTFRAAADQQTLTVTWTPSSGGNLSFSVWAATLF